MHPVRSVKATVIASVAALVIAGFLGSSMLGSARAVSGPIGGNGLLHLGSSLRNATNQSSYALVVVSETDATAAAALPGRSLVYRSGTCVPTDYSHGVPYSQALANGWLLKNASGNLIKNQGYGYYIGDVGNSGYQQAFITSALAFLSARPGLDGVFLDDVLRDIGPLTDEYPAKYPNQAAWAAATVSFISVVGTALRARGYYVLANAVGYTSGNGNSNDGTLDISWWQAARPVRQRTDERELRANR